MPAQLIRRSALVVSLVLPWLAGQLLACCSAPRPAPRNGEAAKYLRAEFARLDANGDGKISRLEFEQNIPAAIDEAERLIKAHSYQPSSVSKLLAWDERARTKFPEFAQVDTNGDGLISFHHEYLGFSSHEFARFGGWDQNGDGQVTQQEFVTAPPEKPEYEQDPFTRPEPVDPVAEERKRRRLALEFVLRDQNSDERLTWSEQVAFEKMLPPLTYEGMNALGAFLNVDANFDGAVSREEFLAHARDPQRFDKNYLTMEENVFRLRDLDGNQSLSFLEFIQTGENLARGFVGTDKDEDGKLILADFAGTIWTTSEKSSERERTHFARLDRNQDQRVTWKEYRSATGRGVAFGAIDLLQCDNFISLAEWDAVEQEYRDGQSGKQILPQSRSFYATYWLPGIFELITFADMDANKDGRISWYEFETFGR
ncbi:hypothetical protein [Anatilimnocola floriformis]|uniref:hypothetical protein n=1 Tax=Anatilimnocola floriformis TaxID=2948575 RepID=UPI0020C42BB7|nr:hypothetical protein [Anatilimnocola floriformis]